MDDTIADIKKCFYASNFGFETKRSFAIEGIEDVHGFGLPSRFLRKRLDVGTFLEREENPFNGRNNGHECCVAYALGETDIKPMVYTFNRIRVVFSCVSSLN